MKNVTLFYTFCFLLLTIGLKAQTPPNAFNYSAVARNAAGQPIATSTIGIQITILKTSPTGASQYSENHFVNTDAYGLFNLVIGTGAVQSGAMATIDWSNDNYYLKVGMDATGGTNFLTMGTTQLLSVPYALYAKSAGSTVNSNDGDTSATNELQTLSISNDTIFLVNGGFIKLPIASGGGTGSNFTHYIGEEFGGGVIFHLWKDAQGVEHGLIVDKVVLSVYQVWSDIDQTLIGPAAQSSWDGLSNSNAIVGQAGHTNSAAALCLNSTNGGFNDWYLPSLRELMILWNNSYTVDRSLIQITGATQMHPNSHWSSTEYNYNTPFFLDFVQGYAGASYFKSHPLYVRAVRAF
jgi:hypothetical protein